MSFLNSWVGLGLNLHALCKVAIGIGQWLIENQLKRAIGSNDYGTAVLGSIATHL
jgi:hypothetical protein